MSDHGPSGGAPGGRREAVQRALILLPSVALAAVSIAAGAASPGTWGAAINAQAAAASALVYLGAVAVALSQRPRTGLLLVCMVFLLLGLMLGLGVIDDAYISLRYARNYAQGHGLVWNVGERVEGYTNFLWVLWLGLVAKLTGSAALPGIARAASVAAGLLTLALTHALRSVTASPGRSRTGSDAGAGLLLVAASYPLLFWSFSGMETSFYLALLLAASWLFVRHLQGWRPRESALACGVLLTLALLTRPETMLIYAAHLVFLAVHERRVLSASQLALALPGVVVFLPYLAWRIDYYGHPLPNTYYAKVGTPFSQVAFGISYLAQGAVAHLVLLSLAVAGWVRAGRRLALEQRYLATMVGLIVLAVVVTGADHFSEWRYFVYLLPYLYLLAADEAARFAGGAAAAKGSWTARLRGAQAPALLAVTAFLLLFCFQGVGPRSVQHYGVNEAERWAELGRWLESNSQPGDLIATPVIGAIGFHTTRPVLDMLGLTDAVIARTPVPPGGRKDHERFDTEYVLGREPAWIYLLSSQPDERRFLEARHWLPAIQDLKRRLPDPAYEYGVVEGERGRYALYRRRR